MPENQSALQETSRMPKPGPLHRWYSICSMHCVYRADCRLCNAGSWAFEPRQKVGRVIFKLSPRLWRWWANR